MNMIIINILLLILTIAGKGINEYIPEDHTLKPTSSMFDDTSDFFASKNENSFLDSRTKDAVQPALKRSTVRNFFKEVRNCRKNYQSISSKIFKRNLYCFLLDPEVKITNENFHCNFTKELIEQLKGKLNLLQFFQEVLELDKNKTLCKPDTVKDTEIEYKKESVSNKNIIGIEIEDNLKLKLGDEWIQMKPKVPYMSHIYLGTSKYPILTEESRILDQRSSLLFRSSTQRIQIKNTGHEDNIQSQSSTVSRIYKLLKPYRWEKNYSRIPRSVQNSVETPYNYSNNPVVGTFFKSASASAMALPVAAADGIYYSGAPSPSTTQNFIERGFKFIHEQILRIFGYA